MPLEHSGVVVLLSGIAFLLFGLSLASDSLQKMAANRIRKILNRLSEDSAVGVAIGALLTLLMQSAGAVTATLVNLGAAGVLTLPQVMGVIIGTAIGATVTVQLLSLHVSEFGLLLFAMAFLASFLGQARKLKTVLEFCMALGLLFFGLELIHLGAASMLEIQTLASAFASIRENWMLGLAVSTVLTSFFHSSTATLGVVMGLTSSGVLDLNSALVWVYGANIGTTTMALTTGLKANYVGRQIAWANFLYRVASIMIFLPFAGFIVLWIGDTVDNPRTEVASVYMALNVVSALLFFPLRKAGVRFIQKIITPNEGEAEFGVRFLKRSNYESFSLGLAHAKREIFEMGDILYQMVELSIEVFRDEDPDHIQKIRSLDDRVDLLLKEIKLFLIRVSDLAPEGLNQSVIDIISVGSDLEGAADMIDHHLVDLAKKKQKGRLEFSSECSTDLTKLHAGAVRATSLAVTYFQTEDVKLAGQLLDLKHEMRDLEQKSREAHIARLGRGGPDNMGVSAIYLETLNTYLQLVELLSRHAQRVSKTVDRTRDPSSRRKTAAD